MHRMSVGLIGGGLIALAFSIMSGWIILPNIIRALVKQSAVLDKGGMRYKVWENSGKYVNIYLHAYFFNVTNPKEVASGGKPIVQEVGPYTYLEKRGKKIISDEENSVKYKETFNAFFEPEMSVGNDETDAVTFINIPFVSVAKLATRLTDSAFILGELNDQLEEKGERLFRTESVRSILFTGFSVKSYIELLTDPLVELAVGSIKIPRSLSNGKFAIYKGKNGSSHEEYEVLTGKSGYQNFGQVISWRNQSEFPWWKGASCNKIEGTDGTLFPPFNNRQTVLKTLVPELCRVLPLIFDYERVFYGLPVFRFSPSREAALAPLKHEPNKCYCADKDTSLCGRNGVFSLSACTEGAPISVSSPHFYDAEKHMIEAVEGMKPREDKHKSFFDIEPISGIIVAAAKRLQFNVEVVPNEAIAMISKVRKLTFPLFWAEETTELPEHLRRQVLKFHHTQGKIETARWSLVGVSIACVILGLIWVTNAKREELRCKDAR